MTTTFEAVATSAVGDWLRSHTWRRQALAYLAEVDDDGETDRETHIDCLRDFVSDHWPDDEGSYIEGVIRATIEAADWPAIYDGIFDEEAE